MYNNTNMDELEFEEVIIEDQEKPEPVETQEQKDEVVIEDEMAIATFNTLRERGIIPVAEDTAIKTWGELDEYIAEIPKLVMENLVASAPEDTQKLIQFAFAKGANLTKEDLKSFFDAYEADSIVAEVDSVEDARRLLEKTYAEQGMRKSVINATLDALEDDGTDVLLEEAKKYAKTNKADKMLEAAHEDNKQAVEKQQKYITDFTEALTAQTYNDKRKELVTKELSEGIANKKLDKIIADPKSIIHLVNFLTYYNPEKNEFDFKDFVNQTFTKESEKLKNNIAKDYFSSVKNTAPQNISKIGKVSLDDYEPVD